MDGLIESKSAEMAGEAREPDTAKARLIEKNKYLYRENKRLKNSLEKVIGERNNQKRETNNLIQKNVRLERKIKVAFGKLKKYQQMENENKQMVDEIAGYKRKIQELNQLQEEKNQLSVKYEEVKKQISHMVEMVLTDRYEWISRLKTLIRETPVDYQEIERRLRVTTRTRHRVGRHARVALFVDVQNMFYSAKNLYNGRLDYEKFLEVTIGGRVLVQATAYIVQTPEINQTKFISLLRSIGYVVRTMDLKTGTGGFAKGNWDVGMAIDILSMIDKIDILIIASGDGDFVPIVKLFQKRGVRVEIFSFAYNTAIDLKEIADRFYPVTEELLIHDPSANACK
ncbi:MAG: NYN domain-containing protein [bacterium]